MSEGELRDLITAGQVGSTDLVWHEGMGDWQPVSKVSALATAFSAPVHVVPAAPPEAPGPPPMKAPSPYQSPVTQQPAQLGSQGQFGEIQSYLWQSIVVTLLCCLPFGVAAIVYAAKVDGLKRMGDWQAAKAASDSAKMWCWISFGVGMLVNLLVFAFSFVGAAASAPVPAP